MPQTSRIRNEYLSFEGRYRKISKSLKRRRNRRKMTRLQRDGFLGLIITSAVAPIATNLLSGIVSKLFYYVNLIEKNKTYIKKSLGIFYLVYQMVVRCSRCMGFKKSHRSACKKCRKSRKEQQGRGLEKRFKKAKRFVKNAINSSLRKLAVSHGLADAPKLYDMGTSKIKNKKIKKIFQI